MDLDLEGVLGSEAGADLHVKSLDQIRDRRAVLQALEESLSYQRRVVQARLDIVEAERVRRRDGQAAADPDELLARLPAILAEHTRAPGLGQAPRDVKIPEIDADLTAQVEQALPVRVLRDLTVVSEADLATAVDRLVELERAVSDGRRVLHGHLDAIAAELTRRYRTGEASVDSLLS
ncbi:MAG TPA: hypothetical protein VK866_07690 [Acidimicrobiales bacterium]|nr:hypothetical protein [Acidimicrobiales bacterium]